MRHLASLAFLCFCLFQASAQSGQSPAAVDMNVYCDGETSSPDAKIASTRVYSVVDEMPVYPGGEEARLDFVKKNYRYTKFSFSQNVKGRIKLNFVITPEGCITRVSLAQTVGGGCDEEALRVLKLMPRWNPGKLDGDPVPVAMSMFIDINMN
jgi:protein TonB